MKRNLIVVSIALVALPALAQSKQAAAVLSANFQTVVSTKSTFLIDSESQMHSNYIPSENPLRWPFAYWLATLKFAGVDPATIESSYGTVLVGAKAFRIPMTTDPTSGQKVQGIGMFGSQHTYIAVLNETQSQRDLSKVLSKAISGTILGKRIWTWTLPAYTGQPDKSTYWAQQVGTSYFVVSNNKTDFETVVAQLATPLEAPPELDALYSHPYWLRRAVDHDPANRGQVDTGNMVSFTMVTDLAQGEQGGTFAVKVIDSDLTMTRKPSVLTDGHIKEVAPLLPVGNGVWEAKAVPFTSALENESLEQLMMKCGFGVWT